MAPSPPCQAIALEQPAPVVVAPASPPGAVAVVKRFDKAARQEVAVVLGVEVTAAQITAIMRADRRARRALTALGRQGHVVTKPVWDEAIASVRDLENQLR